jgi:hypothetical protein
MGEGADGKSALELRDDWQFLVDFLQESRFLASCDISLSFTMFCYLFLLNWLMLIFFCHLGVNSCCYSWYIWHMPSLKSMEIPILTCQQPKRWRTRLSAGTRLVSYNYIKVQTIKLYCCNKYFKLYGFKFILISFNALSWVRNWIFLLSTVYRYFFIYFKNSYRHFRTQFRNLLTQLTKVNRNTTYIRARWSIKVGFFKIKNKKKSWAGPFLWAGEDAIQLFFYVALLHGRWNEINLNHIGH